MNKYINNTLVVASLLLLAILVWGMIIEDGMWVAVGVTSLVWLPIVAVYNCNFETAMERLTECRLNEDIMLEQAIRSQHRVHQLTTELAHAHDQVRVWQERAKEMMIEKGVPIPEELRLNQYPFDLPKT